MSVFDNLGYPVNVDGVWVNDGTGPYSLAARNSLGTEFSLGGTEQPILKGIGDSIGQQFSTALNPVNIMTVDSQGPLPSSLMLQNPVGCDVPTGAERLTVTPIYTTTMKDIFGLDIYGGPFKGEWVHTTESQPGNVQILGTRSDDPAIRRKIPVFGLVMGEAMGQKQYGQYDYTDPSTGLVHKAVGRTDPVVNKPQTNVLYNPTQLQVNKLNQLELNPNALNADGTGYGGAYVPGQNIDFIPGVPLGKAPVVAITSGGAFTVGGHQIAVSISVPDMYGTLHDTALSPSSYAAPITGQQTVGLTIAPAPTVSNGTGYKIWATKVGDTSGDFYLAKTLPGIDVHATVTTTLTTADSTFGAKHVDTPTQIAVKEWLLQQGFPPGTPHVPAGLYGAGSWLQRTDLAGFTLDSGNDGTMYFNGLDGSQYDLEATYLKEGLPGSLTYTKIGDRPADTTRDDANGYHTTLSFYTGGVGRFDSGVKTITVPHTPTDADIPWPTEWWGPIKDGLTAIKTTDDSFWWRSSGAWHTDVDTGGGGGGGGGGTTPLVVFSTAGDLNTTASNILPGHTSPLRWAGSGISIDDGGWVTAGTDATGPTIIFPVTGTYGVAVNISGEGSTGDHGEFEINLIKNGTYVHGEEGYWDDTNQDDIAGHSFKIIEAAAGDSLVVEIANSALSSADFIVDGGSIDIFMIGSGTTDGATVWYSNTISVDATSGLITYYPVMVRGNITPDMSSHSSNIVVGVDGTYEVDLYAELLVGGSPPTTGEADLNIYLNGSLQWNSIQRADNLNQTGTMSAKIPLDCVAGDIITTKYLTTFNNPVAFDRGSLTVTLLGKGMTTLSSTPTFTQVTSATLKSGATNTGTAGQTSGTTVTPAAVNTPAVTVTGPTGLTVNAPITQTVVSSPPATPASTAGAVYLQTSGGTAVPYYVNSSGTYNLVAPAPSQITQAGATTGQVMAWNGSAWAPTTISTGSGTVTSVGLSLPAIFTVSGSPVTTSGTLTATLATQTANTVFAGPTSGSAAAPTFRVLVAGDIPNLDAAKLTTGTVAVARLPLATSSTAGLVQPDNATITISGGVISAVGGTTAGDIYAPLTDGNVASPQILFDSQGHVVLANTGLTQTTTTAITSVLAGANTRVAVSGGVATVSAARYDILTDGAGNILFAGGDVISIATY